jgi:hypothetical protein
MLKDANAMLERLTRHGVDTGVFQHLKTPFSALNHGLMVARFRILPRSRHRYAPRIQNRATR